MLAVDKAKFFSDFEARTGLRLTADRRRALEFLLDALGKDAGFTMIRELAYVLATIRWETAHTFAPIKESRFSRAKNPREWENQDRYWRTGFYGRGYVQITWEDNYRRAGQRLEGAQFKVGRATLNVDKDTFINDPDLVLQPPIAYAIASRGMREGWFTSKKLGDYIKEGVAPDYGNASRIINGPDHAPDIAAIADNFDTAPARLDLTDSVVA